MKLNTQFLFAALTAVTLITPACGGDAGKKTEEKKTDEKPADKAADPAPATPPAAAADPAAAAAPPAAAAPAAGH